MLTSIKRFLNRYGKVIIVYSISFVSLYIIANIVLMWVTGLRMPDSMHILVGTFFGIENGCLCVIKCTELTKSANGHNSLSDAIKEARYLSDDDDNMVG